MITKYFNGKWYIITSIKGAYVTSSSPEIMLNNNNSLILIRNQCFIGRNVDHNHISLNKKREIGWGVAGSYKIFCPLFYSSDIRENRKVVDLLTLKSFINRNHIYINKFTYKLDI